MARGLHIVISFKDIASDEEIRQSLETGCRQLAEEFPETTRFELTLAPDGAGHTAHGHVTGRNTEVAAHTEAIELGAAAVRLLDTLERLLRKVHDKHIFKNRRRAAQLTPKKRRR
jgi:ribosome-associated translation inhibitor RaiA